MAGLPLLLREMCSRVCRSNLRRSLEAAGYQEDWFNNMKTTGKYILCDDLLQWAQWYEMPLRRVAWDAIQGKQISTIFLGLDYSFGHTNPPLLFETMIFDSAHCWPPEDPYQERYATWEEAMEGHKRAIEMVKDLATT